MLTKAIVEKIKSEYEVLIRMPTLDSGSGFSGGTSNAELATATMCVPPQFSYTPTVGDVVFVAFEDNDLGKPVILGCLSKKSGNTSSTNANVTNLNANGRVQLGKQTKIGDISYSQLSYLSSIIGLMEDSQNQDNDIQETLNTLQDEITTLQGKISYWFNSSKTRGYVLYNNELLICWGYESGSGNKTITLPLSYANTSYTILTGQGYNSSTQNGYGAYFDVSTNGFTFVSDSGDNCSSWVTIGYYQQGV